MNTNRTNAFLGLAAGIGLTSCAAILMGQGTTYQPTQPSSTQPTTISSQPGNTNIRMGSEYFVTGDGMHANLWMRDGTSLRWVSSADATIKYNPNDRNNERSTDRTNPDNKDLSKPSSNPK